MMKEDFDPIEVYYRVKMRSSRLKITDDEWLQLEEDCHEWLKTNPPKELRKLFTPLGELECIGMMADAVRKKRKIGRYSENQ